MSRRPEAIDDDLGAAHPGGFVAAFVMPLDRGGREAACGRRRLNQAGRALRLGTWCDSRGTANCLGFGPVGAWPRKRPGSWHGCGGWALGDRTSSPWPTAAGTMEPP
jgi:hypothetical protein